MTRIAACVGIAFLALVTGACSDPQVEKKQYFDNANRFFEEKKYQEAIVEYRNALGVDDKFGEARFKLGEAYVAAGNPRAAYNEFIRAADLLPDDVNAQLRAASFLLLGAQFEDAQTRAERALTIEPRNVEALVIVGNAMAGLKDLDGAVREIEEAIKLDPERSQTYASLAMLRMAQGQRDQAQAAFLRAVELDPESVLTWLALANFQWANGEIADAERSLKRALAVDGANVLANRALAILYLATRRASEAEGPLKTIANGSKDPRSQVGLADFYLSLNRVDEAKKILEPLSKNEAVAAAADTRLAAIAYATDKPAAHKMVDAVLGRAPKHVEALILKSRWLLAEEKPAEALEQAKAATKADPESAQAHYLVGSIQASLRMNAEAIASLNEVVRLNPRAAVAQILLSRLHLATGATDTAVTLAEGAIANVPNNPEAQAMLARTLIARGELDRASSLVQTLMKAFPKAAIVHALDGAIRLQKKDLPGARKSYETALQLAPTYLEALAGLTQLDLTQNQIAQAKRRVEAQLAADPKSAETLYLAASVYSAERDLAKAEAALRKAIELDPAYSPSYSMLAGIFLAQRKLDAARDEFDRIAQRDPKNVGAQTMAAMIVHAQSVPEAKKRYAAILKTNPGAAVAANNLAWIYAEEGTDLDEALRLAQSASAQLPENAAVQDTLGWVYYRRELPELAVSSFENSIARDPTNPEYHYHLALALQRTGNLPRARESVQRALKLKPDHADAQKLAASLKG